MDGARRTPEELTLKDFVSVLGTCAPSSPKHLAVACLTQGGATKTAIVGQSPGTASW